MMRVGLNANWSLTLLLPVVLWSALWPHNPSVWVFEAAPALGLMGCIAWSRRHFPLTPLSNMMLAMGIALMLVGAHYTYAGMPWFSTLRDGFQLSRNHFDRFGHVFQGAVPAIVLRELLVRRLALRAGPALSAVVILMCLGLSAGWELIEWAAVVVAGGQPEVYLNFQGDAFDSHGDMACALSGALGSLMMLSSEHDRQLRGVHRKSHAVQPSLQSD